MISIRGLPVAAFLVAAFLTTSCSVDDKISRDFGARCESNADCTDRCLPSPDWPGGFCTRDCTGDGECASDAKCVDTDDGNVCLFACNDSRDCEFLGGDDPAAWACVEFGTAPDVVRACGGAP